MNCYLCGRPFRWVAPGASGRPQGWFRLHDTSAKGPRCADRNACRNAIEDKPAQPVRQPSLF